LFVREKMTLEEYTAALAERVYTAPAAVAAAMAAELQVDEE
jgi:hypothetical protein